MFQDAGIRIAVGAADSSNGSRSIPIPAYTIQRPLLTGNGGKNYLQDSLTVLSGSQETNNSMTAVSRSDLSSQFGGAPPPPCNGAIYRCRRNPSGTGDSDFQIGILRLTSGASSPTDYRIPAGKIKVRLWLYAIPWDTGNVGNSGNKEDIAAALNPEFALGRYDTTNPIVDSREALIVGPIVSVGDAFGGWFPVTLDTDSPTWTRDNTTSNPTTGINFELGLRVRNVPPSSGPANANPTDFLMALDYVMVDDSSPLEHAGVALPTLASTTTAATKYDPEKPVVSGFACGSTYTIQLAAMIPLDAWDETDTERPSPEPICPLWESSTKYIEVTLLPSTREVEFRFVRGATTLTETLAFDTDPFNAAFLRQSPVLLGLARASSEYRCTVSVSGSKVEDDTWSTPPLVQPTEIRFSNNGRSAPTPMLWFAGKVDESPPFTISDLTSSLQPLGMFFTFKAPIVPGTDN